MKLTKRIINGRETYFKDGVKKYEHQKNSTGNESWSEYDEQGNLTHLKDSNDGEWWSNEHPGNPMNRDKEEVEVNIEPFTFNQNE